MPSHVLDFKTPLEVLSLPFSTSKGVSPKVFGGVCFVQIHSPTRSKLDPCALKFVFVGYSPTQMGINVVITHHGDILSRWMLHCCQTHPHFSSAQPHLQGESPCEEDFSTLLSVFAPVLEQKNQPLLTNEFPTYPTEKSYALHVEELRVYFRRQKSRTIPNVT